MALKIEPELRGDAKIAPETQCGVGRDAPVAMNNLIDPAGRNADVLRQTVLRNAHGLKELLHKNLARVDGGYFSFAHLSAPNDSRRSLRHRRCRRASENKCAIDRSSGCCVAPTCFRSTPPADSPGALVAN